MTMAGMILGTAAYMSPEQAKGRAADKRSDIWAFGCVLYEMLTGRRAFEGDDVSDTLAAIVRGEPDWGALSSDTPPRIDRLLRLCLQKDRRQRVPDAAVARFEIDEALHAPHTSATAVTRHEVRWRMVGVAVAAGTLACGAAGAALWFGIRPEPPRPS